MAGPPGLTRGDLVNLTFEIMGEKQLDKALGIYAASCKDLRAVWPEVREEFIQAERAQFQSAGRSGSGGWPKLSPRYAAWKAAKYPGRPIMVRTGALLRSLTEKKAPGAIYEPGRLGLTLGTSIRYAKYHQSPGARRSRLPRRPVIQFTEAQKRGWVKIIHEFIMKSGGVAASIGRW